MLLVARQHLIARGEVEAHHDLSHPFGRAGRQRHVGGVAGESQRVGAAQRAGQLAAPFEVGGRAAVRQLALELRLRRLDRARRQRPVGARVEVGDPLQHGELAAQSGWLHDRRE